MDPSIDYNSILEEIVKTMNSIECALANDFDVFNAGKAVVSPPKSAAIARAPEKAYHAPPHSGGHHQRQGGQSLQGRGCIRGRERVTRGYQPQVAPGPVNELPDESPGSLIRGGDKLEPQAKTLSNPSPKPKDTKKKKKKKKKTRTKASAREEPEELYTGPPIVASGSKSAPPESADSKDTETEPGGNMEEEQAQTDDNDLTELQKSTKAMFKDNTLGARLQETQDSGQSYFGCDKTYV